MICCSRSGVPSLIGNDYWMNDHGLTRSKLQGLQFPVGPNQKLKEQQPERFIQASNAEVYVHRYSSPIVLVPPTKLSLSTRVAITDPAESR